MYGNHGPGYNPHHGHHGHHSGPHFPHHPHHHPNRHQYQHNMLQWVPMYGGPVPFNAVQGGYDNGETLYVGRAHHAGDLIPGKILPSHNCCYVPHSGNEHSNRQYEVLINPSNCHLVWQRVHGSTIPPGAVQGGHTSDGEPLYVGRHTHHGSVTTGKVHSSHRCLYIAYGGKEHCYHDFEILCVPPTIF